MIILKKYISLLTHGIKENKWAQFVAAFALMLGFITYSPYGIKLVMTPSIPMGVYFKKPIEGEMQRGRNYCYLMEQPAWVPEELGLPPRIGVCKTLAGLAGDKIRTEDGVVTLEYKVTTDVVDSFVHERVSFKRLEHVYGIPIEAPPVNVDLKDDDLFFATDHEKGWDSRYLGVVNRSEVDCEVELIFGF